MIQIQKLSSKVNPQTFSGAVSPQRKPLSNTKKSSFLPNSEEKENESIAKDVSHQDTSKVLPLLY